MAKVKPKSGKGVDAKSMPAVGARRGERATYAADNPKLKAMARTRKKK